MAMNRKASAPRLFPETPKRRQSVRFLDSQPRKEKELEDEAALGGIRNPRHSLTGLPKSKAVGKAVRGVLSKAQQLWPALRNPAKRILRGEEPEELDEHLIHHIRGAALNVLGAEGAPPPRRTARASTSIKSVGRGDF